MLSAGLCSVILPRPQPHQNGRQKKVHLPDVTGLTSAVGTPLRAISQFYRYDPESDGDGEGQPGLIAHFLALIDNIFWDHRG